MDQPASKPAGLGAFFHMAQFSRTFRVFVSSTFSDLVAERNALHEKVFPRLRELAAANNCRFQAIDLRWGVSDEAGLDQQTMKICLDEIERSQATKVKPNFIVLLGDRYGWRPLPYEIPADEFEQILSLVTPEEKGLLAEWYRQDNNAVPPAVLLQPRLGEFAVRECWEIVETALHQALLSAASRLALGEERLLKYTASATELEILAGALKVPDANQHVFCFLRNIQDLPKDGRAGIFGDADQESAQLQQELKSRLTAQLGDNVHRYAARWLGDGPSLDHLDKLCEDVYARLSGLMQAEFGRQKSIDPLVQEQEDHESFAAQRSRIFTGRVNTLKTIETYLAGTDPQAQPLAVWGEVGSGQSALMAKAIEQAGAGRQNVIYRFIGVTAESSSGRGLLASLCRQIAQLYEADQASIPSEYKDLVVDFSARLALAKADKPLTLFLDALDQLADADNGRGLAWLPADLPTNVHLIVSTLPGECLQALESKIPAGNILKIERLSAEEGEAMLDQCLADVKRKLQDQQKNYVLEKFTANGLPLYLKLAFEEARLWKSFTPLPQMSMDVPGILQDLFERLSAKSNHGKALVENSLGYLAAARNGLAEDELIDVLSRDLNVYGWFLETAHHIPNDLIKAVITYLGPQGCDEHAITGADTDRLIKAEAWFRTAIKPHPNELNQFLSAVLGAADGPRLPFVIWSRLYFNLEAYLTRRNADGATLLSFNHLQVKEAAQRACLSGANKNGFHEKLAEYFAGQPLYLEGDGTRTANLRKISEQPWQLASAALWQPLYDLEAGLPFLAAQWRVQPFECKACWTQIEANSRLRMVEAYQALINAPAQPDDEDAWTVAQLLVDTGHFADALPLRAQITAHYCQTGDRPNLATALTNEANILFLMGKLDAALAKQKEAEKIYFDLADADGLQRTLSNEAAILRDKEDLDQALSLYRQAEQICRRVGNRASLCYKLNNMAGILLDQGKLPEAQRLYAESEQLCKELNLQDGLASALGGQAELCYALNQPKKALDLHKQQAQISRRIGAWREVQSSLNYQARIMAEKGEQETALSLLDEQERICRQIGDQRNLMTVRGNRAMVLHQFGRPADALMVLREAEQYYRQNGLWVEVQGVLRNRALVASDSRDLNGAIAALDEARSACEKINRSDLLNEIWQLHVRMLVQHGKLREAMAKLDQQAALYAASRNKAGLAMMLGAQGQLLADLGQPKTALAKFREEEKIYRELGDQAGLAQVLVNLSVILRDLGDYKKAQPLLEEQVAICRASANYAAWQAGLGAQAGLLMAIKKFDEALRLLKQQEDISRAHNISIGIIMALGDQANLLDFKGDARGALALQRQAEQMSRKAGNHEQLAISLTNQALALIKMRQPGEAWLAIDEAESLARSHGLAALGHKIQAARDWMKKYR